MTSVTCDRCGADVTDKANAVVDGIRKPNGERGGEVSESADLCARCYRAVWKFIGLTPRMPRYRRAAIRG
jgi:hypothetical protein